jgi:hypothetical protein
MFLSIQKVLISCPRGNYHLSFGFHFQKMSSRAYREGKQIPYKRFVAVETLVQ